MSNVADKIRLLREDRGISVYQLSKQMGIPQTTLYSMFEKGREPLLSTSMAMAKFFGVPPQFLCDSDYCTDEHADELLLWNAFVQLGPEDRTAVLALAQSLVNSRRGG